MDADIGRPPHASVLYLRPGRKRARGRGLEYEIFWAYSTLAYAHTIQARVLLIGFLSPLSPSSSPETSSAAQLLLPQGYQSRFDFRRHIQLPPLTITAPKLPTWKRNPTQHLAADALFTCVNIGFCDSLLAVLKTDPYPKYLAITSTTRKNDSDDAYSKEYLYNPPNPPKGVKAMLFSRLCIAASEHATKAHGGYF